MIIGSAAHFTVCACGHHGRLVAADGRKTRELCSKEEARIALDVGAKEGFITEDEIPEARRQIDVSPLPEKISDVSLPVRLLARLNDWLNEGEEEASAADDLKLFHSGDRVH